MFKQASFLRSFLSKELKTNQLEVNTDEKTLKPIARLKEPRDLFALPKDKDNDCSQQAARWPTECQVLDERVLLISDVPGVPEPYNQPTGSELKPRPVGEENGVVVYNYNPVSAVNYDKKKFKCDDSDGSDSDISSSESRGSSPEQRLKSKIKPHFSEVFHSCRSSSPSNDESEDEEITKITNLADNLNSIAKTDRIDNKQIEFELKEKETEENEHGEFSRSSVGGSKFLTQVHPFNKNEYNGLWFESRFESGNLAKAVKITDTYYELYLRPDLYTSRSKQWFYFRVERTKKNVTYRFSIVNLVKSDSLYNEGMRPLMYSTTNAKNIGEGWRRCGANISYYRNDDDASIEEDEENWSYTLTFNVEFPHDEDTVYFAHSYPYTYTDLQDYLMAIQKHPVKSKFCKLRLLCRSLAGNNVYYLTVTAPTRDEELMKKKKAIVVSARVHPSETPSSWMMKGLMDFITGDSVVAKRLRHKFIFKLIPMLNPDGVIVGNTRNSLTGKDLNRQYRTVIRETYPSIWYTKAMIKRLIDECGVAMYCDMHAHSRRQNIFVYGCENRRNQDKKLTEQVFPLMMHKNVADKFSFENCKFKIQRSKEGTGRIVVWMLGVTNSYTIEASFGGSSLGSRKGTHFNTGDYEHMGRGFCETLLDYCDENPNKVKSLVKLYKHIKRIRKKERRESKLKKAKKLAEQERLRLKIIERLLKEGSSAEEPLNIPLSDYSSDEGDTSSSSDNEGKADRFSDLEGPCCQPLRAPPCSPEANFVQRRMWRLKVTRRIMKVLDEVYFRPKRRQCRLRQAIRTKNGKEDVVKIWKQVHKKRIVNRKMRIFLKNLNVVIFRKYRKKKQRSKSWTMVQRKRSQRITLDMPTTDPGNDLFFSTDDEVAYDASGSFPLSRRYLLQSELQRRYIDATCDCAPTTKFQRMPPELVVTPANQPSATKHTERIPRTPEAPKTSRNSLSTDLFEHLRRNSLHNIYNTGNCTPKSRLQNLGQTQQIPSHDVFSPKNWMGYSAEVFGCYESSPRSNSSTLRPKPQPTPPPPPLRQIKEYPKCEIVALLTACSQKLTAWQQEALELSNRNKMNLNLVNPSLVSLQVSGIDKDIPKKEVTPSNKNLVSPQVSGNYKDIPKKEVTPRKKKRNLLRITQTTKIVNCFNKHGSQSSINIGQSPRPFTPNTSVTLPPLKKSSRTYIPKKFKPVGLVATAIQTGRKPKRTRSTLININNKQIEIPLVEKATTAGQMENEKSIARKVRTKLKKKKSATHLKGKS